MNHKPSNNSQGMKLDQGAVFKQAARELGCDEAPERFEAALRKVVAHKPPPDEPKRPKSETKKPAK